MPTLESYARWYTRAVRPGLEAMARATGCTLRQVLGEVHRIGREVGAEVRGAVERAMVSPVVAEYALAVGRGGKPRDRTSWRAAWFQYNSAMRFDPV